MCFVTSSLSIVLSQEEADVPYEEEILRHPYSVKCWMRYVEHKTTTGGRNQAVNLIFERALKELPGRYCMMVKKAWGFLGNS